VTRLLVRCPAKVNLGLRVLAKRRDGYHEVATLYQAIDWWDELALEAAGGLVLSVDDPAVPAGEENLVLRAARLLQARVPRAGGCGASLALAKSIPAGAGLGGGSSDAAGALAGLNALWGLGLSSEALGELAAELGSDVPFFLVGGAALGTGRGEVVTPLPRSVVRGLVLGFPGRPLPTAEVYARLRAPLTPGSGDVTVSRFLVNCAERNDFSLVTNDLEAAAFAICGDLVPFRDGLRRIGAETALVSGSGSTVFGLFDPGADVAAIAGALRRSFAGWTVRACRTVESGVRIATAA
jgi:4-diphosphocytidyl-2-C-methyl-D-erythritol kinase